MLHRSLAALSCVIVELWLFAVAPTLAMHTAASVSAESGLFIR
jgi:hypothetical protein